MTGEIIHVAKFLFQPCVLYHDFVFVNGPVWYCCLCTTFVARSLASKSHSHCAPFDSAQV
ncbi:hypothetical protein HanIR_Chr10g0495991 [Helianthus annuus]|nr:hypothetical protein HanIR_Chr10g0495991 [Helianthus annuus]